MQCKYYVLVWNKDLVSYSVVYATKTKTELKLLLVYQKTV